MTPFSGPSQRMWLSPVNAAEDPRHLVGQVAHGEAFEGLGQQA